MFIFACVLLVGAALATVAALRQGGLIAGVVPAGLAAFGLVILLFSSVHIVPTKNVGIVTQFSRPTGRTTGAGLQWVAPWQDVDDWDASGQTFAHLGDRCVWTAIAAQRKACIPVQIEYAALDGRASENWAAYKEVDGRSRFEVFVARRVEPQIIAALTSVFADFDPLATIDVKSSNAPAPNLNATYVQKLTAAVNERLGQDLAVKSVAFESPRYDEPTTKAIEAYGQKILEARNLVIEESNAQTRKRITETNASVDSVTRCLEIAEKQGKEPGLCMTSVASTRPVK